MNSTALAVNKALAHTASSGPARLVWSHLSFAEVPVAATELASELNLHMKSVYKALRVLAALGVVERAEAGFVVAASVRPHVTNALRAMAAGTRTFDVATEQFTPSSPNDAAGSEPAPKGIDFNYMMATLRRRHDENPHDFDPGCAVCRERGRSLGSEVTPLRERADSLAGSRVAPSASRAGVLKLLPATATALSSTPSQTVLTCAVDKTAKATAKTFVKAGALTSDETLGSAGPTATEASGTKRLSPHAGALTEVYAHWKAVPGHESWSLTAGRQRIIVARLNEGFTAAQLKRVVDYAKASDFLSGRPEKPGMPQRKRYDDFANIMGSRDKVERNLANADVELGRVAPTGKLEPRMAFGVDLNTCSPADDYGVVTLASGARMLVRGPHAGEYLPAQRSQATPLAPSAA